LCSISVKRNKLKGKLKYLYNPPEILKRAFGSFIWNSSNGKILLTFDDGPTPEGTEIILRALKENNIKAAFFCVGNNVKKYPELVDRMKMEGHLIGNHTLNHKQLRQLSYTESINEINSFTLLLEQQYKYEVKYFRPPHGKFKINTSSLVKKCGLINVMWSLLTYDFKGDIKEVKLAVDKYMQKDSILVLHDSIKSARIIEDSIKIVLESANKKGYEIGEPEECLR
jgi:peptidoglycan/xylan/chitin deacetylase (PgdA/CDA1 family)